MSSRGKILSAVKASQPAFVVLPELVNYKQNFADLQQQYETVLTGIGGQVFCVEGVDEIVALIQEKFVGIKRIITTDEKLYSPAEIISADIDPHTLEDIDLAIVQAHFAVAENGAVWVTENTVKLRVLPFICQHLVAVVNKKNIVATMHDAYNVIGDTAYGFGAFIAGPSKTADIEQSLVLGAHDPKTMTVIIVND